MAAKVKITLKFFKKVTTTYEKIRRKRFFLTEKTMVPDPIVHHTNCCMPS